MNNSKVHYQFIVFPILLMIVVFVLWASLMKIGEFVRGYGKIVPSGQLKKVQHREGGIVTDILVKEGDQVKEGQILYRIKDEFAVSSLGELQINLYYKMAAEARIRAELNGADSIQFPAEIAEKYPNIVDNEKKLFLQQKSNQNSTQDVLQQQLEQKKSQIQEDRARIKNLQLQYQYAKEQQDILEGLVKSGAGSRKEYIDSKLKTQNLLTDLDDTKNRTITNEKSINEAQSRIEESRGKFISDAQSELAGVLVDIEKYKENIAASKDRISRTEVLSPVDGIIKTMYFNTIGGVVAPGGIVSDIIPINDLHIIIIIITINLLLLLL
jgi:HlyD family secretion protein/adhesin transport system membrane fusion protein